MATYSTYKDSGEPWLGQIPSHWEVRKAKYIWQEMNAVSLTGTEQLLSVSQYDGVKPTNESSRSESLKGYKIVKKDSLVINIMLAWLGGLGVSKFNGVVSPAYCVYKPITDANTKYLNYLYKNPIYLAEFARRSTGVVPSRWRMYTDDFGQVLTILPPLPEQEAIVHYLDEQTSSIDSAIQQKQALIDLLQQRKQIIITQTVTQGLNPSAPTKDSGIDWIGTIPKHWEIKRLKYVSRFYNGYPFKSDTYCNDGTYKVVTIANVQSYGLSISDCKKISNLPEDIRDYQILQIGDMLMSMTGNVGRVCFVDKENCLLNQRVGKIVNNRRINKKYLFYVLSDHKFIEYLNLNSNGSAQLNAGVTDICNYRLSLPPISEQQAIADYLDKRMADIDAAIAPLEKMISLLQERKQIIINDVVTGKVKVI